MNKQKGLAPILIVLLIALGIGGYLMYQKQTKPVSVSQQVAQSTSTTTSNPGSTNPVDIANWKTYTNSAYKFSLKYPPNYSVKEQFNIYSKLLLVTISTLNPKPGGGYPESHVEMVVFKNDANDLNSWISKHTTTLPFDDPSVSKVNSQFFYRGVTNQKEVLLGGKKAITFESRVFESSPNPTLTVLDNYIIGLVLDKENETKDPNLKEIYPQILSTFRFDSSP